MEKVLLPGVALAAWSVYSVLFTMASKTSSPLVVLAVYTTVFAGLSWIAVAVSLVQGESLSFAFRPQDLGLVLGMGVLAFIANYSFLRGLVAGVEPTTIYLTIALVACGSLLTHCIIFRQLPTVEQASSIALGSIAAFIALRAK